MPPPTLHYASLTASPVRFRPLALAAGLLALTNILSTFAGPVVHLFRFKYVDVHMYTTAASALFFHVAIIAAIPFFAAALPPSSGRSRKRPITVVCLVIAALFAVASAAGNLSFLYIYNPNVYLPFEACATALSASATLCEIFLLTCAALYLLALAKRLQHPALGILAACPLILTAFLVFIAFLYDLLLAPIVAYSVVNHAEITQLVHLASTLSHLALTLLWLSLALFTALLALQQPRHPASTHL